MTILLWIPMAGMALLCLLEMLWGSRIVAALTGLLVLMIGLVLIMHHYPQLNLTMEYNHEAKYQD